jgi:oligosaccharide repeat unit polymerase
MGGASFVLCAGLGLAWINLPAEGSLEIFGSAAVVVGIALTLAVLLEFRAGVRNLLRADLLMLVALYALTFLEYLFPHPEAANHLVTSQSATDGTTAVLLGFAGLAVGRHILPGHARPRESVTPLQLAPRTIMFLFVGTFLVGYFHMLWAVGFNVVELVSEMLDPRFSQPWGRGRYGGWADLLNELGLLIYLIPPLAGIVLARHRVYRRTLKLIVVAGLLFTLFYGFSTGTRNVFAVHVITFVVAYLAFLPRLTFARMLLVGGAAGLLLLASAYYMLDFRQIGLGRYLDQGAPFVQDEDETLFIDDGLVTISRLTGVFPDRHDFLGLEIPYHALIHPIPRAIWPGKPEGLSVSIEEALGARQTTLAVTFVGEAYMSGGYLGVILASLLFGAAAARWNRVGQAARSNFDIALYASGFFAIAISMRSLLWLSVAILPALALWAYGRWHLRRLRATDSTMST